MALASSLLSDEKATALLESYNWKMCESESLNEFWRNRWGQPLITSFLDPWPTWQAALTGPSAKDDVKAWANKLKIVGDDLMLGHTEFYDLSPGDFAALGSTNNRIAIRSDYIRLYNHICTSVKRSAVVTGQPTSGKTYFLYYCLLQRLALGLPVLLSPMPSEWYLFSRWGVRKSSDFQTSLNDDTKYTYRTLIPPETWALIDGDARPRGQDLERQLSAGHLNITTVFASLPYAGHYDKWFSSTTSPLLRVLKPAVYEEIAKGCRLFTGLPLSEVEPSSAFEQLIYFMTVFGYAEGQCLRCFSTSYDDAVKMLRREIGRIKFSVLQRIFASLKSTDQLNPEAASIEGLLYLDSEQKYRTVVNMISIITPRHPLEPSGNDSLGLDIASDFMLRQLFREFLVQNTKHVQEFMDLCTRHAHTKALAGYFFEEVIHIILADAQSEWRDRCTLTEFFPFGRAAHVAMNPLPLRRGHVFRKRSIITYRGLPPDFDPRTYKQPFAKNNPTFDSVLHAADYDAPASELPDPEHQTRRSPPPSPSTRKSVSTPRKRSKRPPSPPAASPFHRPEPETSSSPAKGKGIDRTMGPPALPLYNVPAPVASTSTSMQPHFSADFRADSPDSVSSYAASSRAPSEFSAAMSDAVSDADEPPSSTISGSDAVTVRGHSPFATRSVRERPKPPASVSVLGRRKRRAVSTADGRPTKVARTEVPHAERHYVALQMTVSQRHSWNEKGFKLLEKSFREVGNWHFVVVTHKRSNLDLDALEDELRTQDPGRTYAHYYRWYHLAVDLTTTIWDSIEFEDEDFEEEEEFSIVDGESQDGGLA